jgi:hypothetical protein
MVTVPQRCLRSSRIEWEPNRGDFMSRALASALTFIFYAYKIHPGQLARKQSAVKQRRPLGKLRGSSEEKEKEEEKMTEEKGEKNEKKEEEKKEEVEKEKKKKEEVEEEKKKKEEVEKEKKKEEVEKEKKKEELEEETKKKKEDVEEKKKKEEGEKKKEAKEEKAKKKEEKEEEEEVSKDDDLRAVIQDQGDAELIVSRGYSKLLFIHLRFQAVFCRYRYASFCRILLKSFSRICILFRFSDFKFVLPALIIVFRINILFLGVRIIGACDFNYESGTRRPINNESRRFWVLFEYFVGVGKNVCVSAKIVRIRNQEAD